MKRFNLVIGFFCLTLYNVTIYSVAANLPDSYLGCSGPYIKIECIETEHYFTFNISNIGEVPNAAQKERNIARFGPLEILGCDLNYQKTCGDFTVKIKTYGHNKTEQQMYDLDLYYTKDSYYKDKIIGFKNPELHLLTTKGQEVRVEYFTGNAWTRETFRFRISGETELIGYSNSLYRVIDGMFELTDKVIQKDHKTLKTNLLTGTACMRSIGDDGKVVGEYGYDKCKLLEETKLALPISLEQINYE